MKQSYIERITKQIAACDDLALLDLISTLLGKVCVTNA